MGGGGPTTAGIYTVYTVVGRHRQDSKHLHTSCMGFNRCPMALLDHPSILWTAQCSMYSVVTLRPRVTALNYGSSYSTYSIQYIFN